MKAHVQNPWTRSPSLMVNMSVEEVGQLMTALNACMPSAAGTNMTDNAFSALADLRRTLLHALETDRPNGLKGATP